MAKENVSRTSSVSIEVVGNGYSVKIGGDGSGDGVLWITHSGLVSGSSSLSGTYVFNDFSQLSTFLRKRLSVPAGA